MDLCSSPVFFIAPPERLYLLCALPTSPRLKRSLPQIWSCLNPGNSSDSSTQRLYRVEEANTSSHCKGGRKTSQASPKSRHDSHRPPPQKNPKTLPMAWFAAVKKEEGGQKHNSYCVLKCGVWSPWRHIIDGATKDVAEDDMSIWRQRAEGRGEANRRFDERAVDCKSIRAAGVMKAHIGDETADKYE